MIAIKNVSKSYRDKVVLNDINLNIENGCIGLIGPNGAGKTTLIKAIFDLIHYNGSITIDGLPFNRHRRPAKLISGVLLREFPTNISVFNYIRSIAIAYDISKDELFRSFEEAKVTSYMKKTIKNLSLGMSQRVAIAVALLLKPHYLIFDEPLNGLDHDSIMWFRNYIENCKKENKVIIISSHILSELEKVADTFVFIKNGAILAEKVNRSDQYIIVKAVKDVLDKLEKRFKCTREDNLVKIQDKLIAVNNYIHENKLDILQVYEMRTSLEEYYQHILKN